MGSEKEPLVVVLDGVEDPRNLGAILRTSECAGVDGVFMEVHEEPSRARSDAANALRLDALEALILKLQRIDAAARQPAVAVAGRARA